MNRRTDPESTTEWNAGWEETRRRQQALGLEVSPTERLRWLEEVIRIAHASGALPRPRDENGQT